VKTSKGFRLRTWVAITALLVIAIVSIVLITRGDGSQVLVPTVVGLSQSQAQSQLTNDGLAYVTEVVHRSTATPPQSGTVISQDPTGGTRVRQGTVVTIVVYTF